MNLYSLAGLVLLALLLGPVLVARVRGDADWDYAEYGPSGAVVDSLLVAIRNYSRGQDAPK